jgi:hypothetical protein
MPLTESGRPFAICGSNPPFSLAVEFVKRALQIVQHDGVVFMLQRLNFLGSLKRRPFWTLCPPAAILVHTRRPAFDPDKPKQTDSVEYAHFLWVKNASTLPNPPPAALYFAHHFCP